LPEESLLASKVGDLNYVDEITCKTQSPKSHLDPFWMCELGILSLKKCSSSPFQMDLSEVSQSDSTFRNHRFRLVPASIVFCRLDFSSTDFWGCFFGFGIDNSINLSLPQVAKSRLLQSRVTSSTITNIPDEVTLWPHGATTAKRLFRNEFRGHFDVFLQSHARHVLCEENASKMGLKEGSLVFIIFKGSQFGCSVGC